jgi:adenylate kinase
MKLENVIILLGPPGSGKGTQADLLAKNFGYFHFGMGQLIRDYMRDNPEDKAVRERYDNGILQPDEFILDLFQKNFEKYALDKAGIVFDAFPMSLGQAKMLDEMLTKHDIVPKVFYIDLSEEEILRRLSMRKLCVDCKSPYLPGQEEYDANACRLCGGHMAVRTDDKPEVIKNRIAEYEERTGPIREFYKSKQELTVVNGKKQIEQVYLKIVGKIAE